MMNDDEGNKNNNVNGGGSWMSSRLLPKRIILVRHGESQGNTDPVTYSKVPSHKIALNPKGEEQAKAAGLLIRDIVSDNGNSTNWKAFFYVSPYERTRATLRGIGSAFPRSNVIGVKEECRMREQDFGNLQDPGRMKEIKALRKQYGRFFYRVPEGESGADVYDRVSSFLESLWRDIDMNRFECDPAANQVVNLIIVSHGLTLRVFLMKWFKWTVSQFEHLKSPKNCEVRVMELGYNGEYSLSFHHDDAKLEAWGLSPEMIADQKLRAYGRPVLPDDHDDAAHVRRLSYFDTFFFDQVPQNNAAAAADDENIDSETD